MVFQDHRFVPFRSGISSLFGRALLLFLRSALLLIGVLVALYSSALSSSVTITGHVYNSQTGAPVENARILVSASNSARPPVYTDSYGRFMLDLPAEGSVNVLIHVSAERYDDKRIAFDLSQDQRIEIHLSPRADKFLRGIAKFTDKLTGEVVSINQGEFVILSEGGPLSVFSLVGGIVCFEFPEQRQGGLLRYDINKTGYYPTDGSAVALPNLALEVQLEPRAAQTHVGDSHIPHPVVIVGSIYGFSGGDVIGDAIIESSIEQTYAGKQKSNHRGMFKILLAPEERSKIWHFKIHRKGYRSISGERILANGINNYAFYLEKGKWSKRLRVIGIAVAILSYGLAYDKHNDASNIYDEYGSTVFAERADELYRGYENKISARNNYVIAGLLASALVAYTYTF